jgi:hypothetical protein
MVQKQIAFGKAEQQQIRLTLSDISPKWARRLGEQQQQPVPMSIAWLRWWRCMPKNNNVLAQIICFTGKDP